MSGVDTPSDEKLVADFAAGDNASFELLVRRHAREVYQYAMRLTGSSTAAEDVVQETFLKLFVSAPSFNPARRFKPWLFTIAINHVRDSIRRRDQRREVSLEAEMDEEHLGDQTFRQWIEAPPDSLEDDGVHPEEKRRLVREVIDELPTRSREILILAYFHRFGYQEIGQIVGIPMGTVKSRLNYAIRRFSVRYRAALLNRREEKP